MLADFRVWVQIERVVQIGARLRVECDISVVERVYVEVPSLIGILELLVFFFELLASRLRQDLRIEKHVVMHFCDMPIVDGTRGRVDYEVTNEVILTELFVANFSQNLNFMIVD